MEPEIQKLLWYRGKMKFIPIQVRNAETFSIYGLSVPAKFRGNTVEETRKKIESIFGEDARRFLNSIVLNNPRAEVMQLGIFSAEENDEALLKILDKNNTDVYFAWDKM